MKYSIKFIENDFDEDIDEYWIKYKKNYSALNYFISEYEKKNKRIVIKIFEDEIKNFDYQCIKNLNNIAYCLPYSEIGLELFNLLKKETTNDVFFMDIIKNTKDFYHLILLGVSDIYIGGDLGFDLKDISKKAHSNNIKIRCIPNIYQKNEEEKEIYKGFFIRPEEIKFYEEYVDILEFYIDKIEEGPWYYNIYKNVQRWFGNLQDIIYNLPEEINSYSLILLGENRSRCKKKCNNNKCELCKKAINLSKTMEENEIWFDYKK